MRKLNCVFGRHTGILCITSRQLQITTSLVRRDIPSQSANPSTIDTMPMNVVLAYVQQIPAGSLLIMDWKFW